MRNKYLKFFVLLCTLIFSLWCGQAALTARADSVDLNQTIGQLFPSNSSDKNTQIVRSALAKIWEDKLTGKTSLTDDTTLADLKGVYLDVDQPLTDYAPLARVAPVLGGLTLENQTNLSGTNLQSVMQDLLENRDSSLGRISLLNDQLTNDDLSSILTVSRDHPTSVGYLNLYDNQISDFSAWVQYKRDLGETSPISVLNAPFQQTSASLQLPTVKRTGTTVKLPLAGFEDYSTAFPNSSTDFENIVLINFSPTVSQSLIDHDQFDALGVITNEFHSILNANTNPNQMKMTADDKVDFSLFNTLDSQSGYLNALLSKTDFQSFIDTGAVASPPADYDNLTVTHVPLTTKDLSFQIITQSLDRNDSGDHAIFTQNYTLPLNTVTANNSGSQTTNASAATAESTTPKPTAKPAADHAKAPAKIITATHKIGLYQSPTFSAKQRLHWYTQTSRTQRPMFQILGVAYAKSGALRYHVKDITPGAKTNGQTGYITANAALIGNAYYHAPAKKIKVLRGLNSYRTAALTGKKHHYRKNQVIRVTKLVKHKLTTRYQLPNGRYVSANKRLIINVK
ncbi:DUF5776 domain-containing protein [Levilactobacillus angrenensis]|uniref:DUF5776 domain-containing protein n=1 Tax=Levilactobacillus angrenensis TaxID=2486020 RepID=A0ABW1UAY8_9LACO|nr:DUF5776 domain-containing protein [Levilactobacillus angrenensis]